MRFTIISTEQWLRKNFVNKRNTIIQFCITTDLKLINLEEKNIMTFSGKTVASNTLGEYIFYGCHELFWAVTTQPPNLTEDQHCWY
jgi:hypothetical protein